MKRIGFILLLATISVVSVSFAAHKFYVSIYQIEYVPEKKRLQITSRIFIDDLNDALRNEYKSETNIGEPNQSQKDEEMMQQYMAKHFSLNIDGQKVTWKYKSSEVEDNVLISYFSVTGIENMKTVKVFNDALTEINPGQQNIIQLTSSKTKRNLLLTGSDPDGTVTF